MSDQITHEQVPPGFTPFCHLRQQNGMITDVAWSRDGRMLAIADSNNTIRICSADHGETIWKTEPLFTEVRMAWSPDGKTLAIGCGDTTIRLFNVETGKFCDQIFQGHSDWVWNLEYSPDGRFLASNSRDKTIRLWNTTTGKLHQTLEVDDYGLFKHSLVWSPDSQKFISADFGKLLLWDSNTGGLEGIIEGEKGEKGVVHSLAISPDQCYLAVASNASVQIWDLQTSQLICILEGHAKTIECISFSYDGRLLASQDLDETILIWRCDIWEKVAVVSDQDHMCDRGLAFNPIAPLLVTVNNHGMRLSIWNIDIDFLLNASDGFESVRYRNAKVVLVGDTGVGKSGLGTVLAGYEFQPTFSTHGRYVWSLEVTQHQSEDDIEESREILLWDLAGQAEFRLIHQLSLDDTSVALVLFDASSPTDPFKGVTFWNKALRQTKGSGNLIKYLVAARIDVSPLQVTDDRINEFASRLGFDGVFRTSALTGEGINELLQQIKQAIEWEKRPFTVSERLFKQMKDFIVNQKQNGHVLKTVLEIGNQFKIIHSKQGFNASDFRVAIESVEAHDLVKILSFGDYVLLQPEVLDNYASAMARAAREQPDGLGFLDEQAAREGQFNFGSLERLAEEDDERVILQSVVELFITKKLAILDRGQLVFPSQFNRELPEYPNLQGSTVCYTFEGALLNAYATLVVRLYHSEAFKLDSLWKNAAIFLPYGFRDESKRCGFLLEELNEAMGQMTVFFGLDVPDETKVLFLKYIHEHLRRKSLDNKVKRERLYRCPSCYKDVKDREAVKFRLEQRLSTIRCAYCDENINLKDLIEETFGENDEFQKQVRQLDDTIEENLDNASKETILKGEVTTIVAKAGQIFRLVLNDDNGIDGEIEFKNHLREASGERIYVQLKSGGSYLKKNRDGNLTFYIEKYRHIEYWLSQPCDVYLIVRHSDEKIYWMNITEYLNRRPDPKPQTIVFPREEFTVAAVKELRQIKIKEAAKSLKPASRVNSEDSIQETSKFEEKPVQLKLFED